MKQYKLDFAANIILMLRDQDVALLLNAVNEYKPTNTQEEENRAYLLGLLKYLSLP